MLTRSNPERAERLLALAQQDIDDQWHYYEQMAGVERQSVGPVGQAFEPDNQTAKHITRFAVRLESLTYMP